MAIRRNKGKGSGIGKRLWRERLAVGKTLVELASDSGLTIGTISMIESGKSLSPGIDTVWFLAKALRCDPEYLAGWE